MELLSREQFRQKVFERDNRKCIVCDKDAVDAHHIINRSLFDDGGYYVDNGVSLCSGHHIKAETTELSCNELRTKAEIKNITLPGHFYKDENYDHWGNIIRPNGSRIAGELFHKESVRNTIEKSGHLKDFIPYVKFPRTYHFPWSPNLQNDDRMLENVIDFHDCEVIGTIKMDGESCTMYHNYIHARSVDSGNHESRNWVKGLHGRIAHDIPEGWRVCGENLYAQHSIAYNNLPDYFLVFSIWNKFNRCLSWDMTEEWAELIGLKTVPVFYRGIFNKEAITEAFDKYCETSKDEVEGYVIRHTGIISYGDYRRKVGKYVRKNHVQTDEFWMKKPVIKNGLLNHD